ncbi:MAG: DNA repair ATPase, partial [Nannocystaceae bacterium]
MAESNIKENPAAQEQEGESLEGGSYEVIRARLIEQGKELAKRSTALNETRKETFGGTELTVTGNVRVRTENACVPCDIVEVGGKLLFSYNVKMGLKEVPSVADAFVLQS